MKYNQLQALISKPRLERYRKAVNYNRKRAVKLYEANLHLAKAFHPLLGIIEVTLRNKLDLTLGTYFQAPDWVLTQQNSLPRNLSNSIAETTKKWQKLNRTVSAGMLIAEQTFGFWTEFFAPGTFGFFKGRPLRAFSVLPAGAGRKDVHVRLSELRRFRNRINHNEPICFDRDVMSFQFVQNVHGSLYDVARWLDADLENWMKTMDKVPEEIQNARKI